MKILHTVESYEPVYNGMQQVVKQISERIASFGHEVTIATSYHPKRVTNNINGVKIQDFKISGKAASGYNADQDEIERYINFVINSDFDIVTNFAAQQWATDLLLPILSKIKSHKIFVPTGFSELHNPNYYIYFNSMKTWMKSYDMNIFLSNDYQDINFARANGISKIKIITNGASHEEFSIKKDYNVKNKLSIPRNHFLILHVGSHTGLKGHDEAIKIFNKAKLLNTTFLIIGNSTNNENIFLVLFNYFLKKIANIFSKRKYIPSCYLTCTIKSFFFRFSFNNLKLRKKIIIADLSRDETIKLYNEADLFLFPSNIECSPIVLFECLASKTPFLTTDVGNAKEIISWTNSGVLISTINSSNGFKTVDIDFAVKILEESIDNIRMLKNNSLKSYELFLEKYTWEKISKQYEELYLTYQNFSN